MTQFERLTVIAGFVGIFINVILLGAFVWQLRVLGKQVDQASTATNRDHERRRKQATIDFYASTLQKRAELRTTLPYDRDSAGILVLIEQASVDDKLGKMITEYLNLFELLAAGVNTDVFDFSVVERVAGGRIMAIARNYSPWIEWRRKLLENPRLYLELELLAEWVEKHRASGKTALTVDLLLEGNTRPTDQTSLGFSCAQPVGGDACRIQRQARRRLPV
jgi:hypothetical protein